MPGIKELKTRIKSVQSTRKITKAMQMVSAAKMRKAQTSALNSRKYSDLAWELINNLTAPEEEELEETDLDDEIEEVKQKIIEKIIDSPIESINDQVKSLITPKPNATKTGIIIISTNKGLVGSFNTNLVNKLREVEKSETNLIAELLVMGKKVKDVSIRTNRNIISDFTKSDNWTSIENIYPLAKAVTDLYTSGEYKKILIIYSHFVSTLTQKATVKQLLPLEANSKQQTVNSRQSTEFLFEPTPELVLNHLVPRIIESQIYQAVLESDASEHSARMIMMKNATEAAGDLIADYTLTYNQLRQGKITTELAEITAGRIALE